MHIRIIALVLIGWLFWAPALVSAATYYFSTSGNDSTGDGSYATPWKTIEKANSAILALSNGEHRIAFKCGDDWDSAAEFGSATYLNITVSGSGVSTETIICAYEAEGDFTLESGDVRPIIDGYHTHPAAQDNALIWVTGGNDYVIIQDLDVRNSEGHGIKTGNGCSYVIIKRNVIDNIYGTPIYAYSSSYVTIEYNSTNQGAMRYPETGLPASPNGGIGTNSSTYSTIQNNFVRNSWMEGISLGPNDTCEDNTIEDCRTVALYLNRASNATVAYNTIVGTSDTDCDDFVIAGWHGHGIALALESTATANVNGNKIHNNNVANCVSGLRCYDSSASYSVGTNYVYNNTFTDNYRNFWFTNTNDQLDGSVVTFKNNLSYASHAASDHAFMTGSTLDSWVFDYTLWGGDSAPSGWAVFTGANDVTGVPFAKTSWRGTIDNIDDLAEADFIPIAYAIDVGEDLGADYDDAINGVNSTFITTNPHPALGTAISISTTDQDTAGVGWDIGAVIGAPVVTVVATDATADEDGGTGVYTISCAPNCAGETINYSWSGGATLNDDFNATDEDGTIDITGASTTITLTPVDDADIEAPENATMTIDAGTGYVVGSPSYGSIVITDNDGPTPPIGGADMTLSGGSLTITPTGGSLTVTISPSP